MSLELDLSPNTQAVLADHYKLDSEVRPPRQPHLPCPWPAVMVCWLIRWSTPWRSCTRATIVSRTSTRPFRKSSRATPLSLKAPSMEMQTRRPTPSKLVASGVPPSARAPRMSRSRTYCRAKQFGESGDAGYVDSTRQAVVEGSFRPVFQLFIEANMQNKAAAVPPFTISGSGTTGNELVKNGTA